MTSPRPANAVTVASCGRRHYRRGQDQIAGVAVQRFCDRSRVAASAVTKMSVPALRALPAIRSAVNVPPGILTIRIRGRRTLNAPFLQRAHQKIARPHAAPGFNNAATRSDIAARPPHALPRNRLRQRLYKRPELSTESGSSTQSQPSGMASPASTQTGGATNGSGE